MDATVAVADAIRLRRFTYLPPSECWTKASWVACASRAVCLRWPRDRCRALLRAFYQQKRHSCNHQTITGTTPHTPQPFYGPFAGTTRVSRCQKRTSGLYSARKD